MVSIYRKYTAAVNSQKYVFKITIIKNYVSDNDTNVLRKYKSCSFTR
jgi:DNA transposition AAA+ family ATPase